MTTDADRLRAHYGSDDLGDRIAAALPEGPVDRALLAALDEFHSRGLAATREIARLAGLARGMRVLDLGCGLGGPARTFAAEFGCRVDGVEIVDEFCRAATMLNGLVGQEDEVTIHQADMRILPFAEDTFDRACTLHTLLNVPDKTAFLEGVARVLKPAGKFFFYEIATGSGEGLQYPVPWASGPELDHIATPTALKAALAGAGFAIEVWEDASDVTLDWFTEIAAQRKAAPAERPGGPTLALVMGPDAGRKSRNLHENLRKGRIRVIRGLASVSSPESR